MNKELKLWQFVATRLRRGENVILLVVAESLGSSPGRQGYKMAVGTDGELYGSIGGGVMEVNLVEQSRSVLRDAEIKRRGDAGISSLSEQVHRENSPNASGMICSGKQTVILKLLATANLNAVESIIDALQNHTASFLKVTDGDLVLTGGNAVANERTSRAFGMLRDGRVSARTSEPTHFKKLSDTDFLYTERLGFENDLYIIGGGHCALALSELMSKMDFRISLFDDRPELNTIEKNRFAHAIEIIDGYQQIGDHVPAGDSSYVVVMTLGYKSDAEVIRALIDKDFKYFGVLGSNAKMSAMLRSLVKEGLPADRLDRIRTPVGLPINSRTPEEIAVSIAAEIISVKNA